MAQKIIQVGNSYAVTIPRKFAKDADFKPGQEVDFYADIATQSIRIEKISKKKAHTQELADWLEKFNKKYKKGLTELAKK